MSQTALKFPNLFLIQHTQFQRQLALKNMSTQLCLQIYFLTLNVFYLSHENYKWKCS